MKISGINWDEFIGDFSVKNCIHLIFIKNLIHVDK